MSSEKVPITTVQHFKPRSFLEVFARNRESQASPPKILLISPKEQIDSQLIERLRLTVDSQPENGNSDPTFIEYERLSLHPRDFPYQDPVIEKVFPEYIASETIRQNPKTHQMHDFTDLAQNILQEQQSNFQLLITMTGLDKSQLESFILTTILSLQSYLTLLGIDVAQIPRISVLITPGRLKGNKKRERTFASMNIYNPFIFVDMKNVEFLINELYKAFGEDKPLNEVGQIALMKLIGHEYIHLLTDIAYWERKGFPSETNQNENAVFDISPAKFGYAVFKPAFNGDEDNLTARGIAFSEGLTELLAKNWFFHIAGFDIEGIYSEEIDIVSKSIHLLEGNLTPHWLAYRIIVQGMFDHLAFRRIVKAMSGKTTDENDHIRYARRSFVSTLFYLMNLDQQFADKSDQYNFYGLTQLYMSLFENRGLTKAINEKAFTFSKALAEDIVNGKSTKKAKFFISMQEIAKKFRKPPTESTEDLAENN